MNIYPVNINYFILMISKVCINETINYMETKTLMIITHDLSINQYQQRTAINVSVKHMYTLLGPLQ